MRENILRIIFTILLVLGMLWGFASIWVWALVGMPQNIGTACGVTAFTFIMIGGLGTVVTSDSW